MNVERRGLFRALGLFAAGGMAAVAFSFAAMAADDPAPGFKRAWGLHCDFHANTNSGSRLIGGTLKEEDIREICELLKPDFLQIDCKGHPGWASYPSKLGNGMPQFKGDPLKVWRRVTRELGVPLYMHYSGIYDTRYSQLHPEEAILDKDGKRTTSLKANGPYVDKLVIPQLCELAGDYGVDGVWIDGDCWAAGCDYEEKEVKKFEQATGIDLKGKAPKTAADPHFHEFCDYYRELYRRYLRHLVDAVHARYPNFKIASNWSYSSYRPEDVDANVDFISGDLASVDSVRSARTAARINMHGGRPWDLMGWGFSIDWKPASRHIPKTPVELMQEAAAVISLGGGFQIYICQHGDGSPDMARIRELKPVAEFVRSREPYCFGGQMKKELAVLISARNQYRENGSALFGLGGMGRATGLIHLFADYGRSVGVALDSDLKRGKLGEWPVLVIPELYDTLPAEDFAALADWVKRGGKLVITGNHTCDVFAKAGFPTALNDDMVPNERGYTMDGGKTVGTVQWSRTLKDDAGEVLARTEDGLPFAAVRAFGKGRVFVCGADFGYTYENVAQYKHAELLLAGLDRLYVPIVRVKEIVGAVETSVLEKDGKLFVQLVNVNGEHANLRSYTVPTIPPVVDLKLELTLKSKPKEIVLQPAGRKLDFKWSGKSATVEIARLDLYDILEIR